MSRSAPPHPPRPGVPDTGPIRLAGELPLEAPSAEYDALADLFLTEPGSRAGASSAPRPGAPAPKNQPATIEGLIVGHLPVLAAPWVSQYARQVSDQTGEPVALVRLRAGQVTVDLIGADDQPVAASIEAAIAGAAARARVWLVRVDEPSEPRLAELPDIDAVTLLTGADEAAVVASYRTIKTLTEHAFSDEADTVGTEFKLAIMGAPPERAAEASAKLARAVETFLGRAVRVATCSPRIGAGRSVQLYRGRFEGTADEALAGLTRLIRSVSTHTPAIAPVPIAAAARYPEPAAPRPPVPHPGETAASSPDSTPTLASHIAGLAPLAARCPYAGAIQFATDAEGALHLLARGDGADAFAQLTAAEAWARAHASLLAQAFPALDGARQVVMHLFTGAAPAVRPLLDAGVRLHLLAQVSVGGKAAWFSAPLN